MTQILSAVIIDCGDGSNSLLWVQDDEVLDRMKELADEGDEKYASGGGLQVRRFLFPDEFDLAGWRDLNRIRLTHFNEV